MLNDGRRPEKEHAADAAPCPASVRPQRARDDARRPDSRTPLDVPRLAAPDRRGMVQAIRFGIPLSLLLWALIIGLIACLL